MILCRNIAQGATETVAHPKRQRRLLQRRMIPAGRSTPAVYVADQKAWESPRWHLICPAYLSRNSTKL
jgi:hypothetical protein